MSENAVGILKKRYLEPDESVDSMFRRVANGEERYIEMMEKLDFLPNSPTLMNAGTKNEGKSTFSACFKFDIADSMLEGDDSIIETGRKAAGVAKWGGGVGYYLGNLRARGAPIRSVHRVACGPVNVLWWLNDIGTRLITQGGRRELAQMAILPVDHGDIREFIHCKDEDPQALRTFNISVAANNGFMKRVFGELAGSKDRQLWDEIIDSAWKTGDPGLYFPDTAEQFNPTPHLGKLTGTNPCGEVPLLNNEACNLGSINLGNFVTISNEVDWNRLEEVVVRATCFLDSILDRNTFPHLAITTMVAKTRKLGLGVMGWADMLALMGIHYDTPQAVELGGKIMKFIDLVSRDTSIRLAKEKGPYPGFEGKDGGEPFECRNATRTCIAPTGTISILCDASSGIEPHFAVEWTRMLNAGVKDKEELIHEQISVKNRLNGFVPKIANEIDWQWHVRHQAAFQKHTNLAVSKTINMPNSATREDIAGAYKMMWEMGCKGGTIFRDGCRAGGEQVLKAKEPEKPATNGVHNRISANGNGNGHVQTEANGHSNGHLARRKPPRERPSITHHMTIGEFDGYVTAGMHPDGVLCEIFIKASKEGSTVSGMLDSWAITFSHCLQHGCPLENLVRKFSGMRFEPSGLTGNSEIPFATSIVDYIVRWLDRRFGAGRDDPDYKGSEIGSGMICPDCHGPAIYQGGCLTCKGKCGWSRCG
jgi:ribonucleoside-diphosphate reductase alpha chain